MNAKEFDKKLQKKVVKAEKSMPPSAGWDLEKSWQMIMAGIKSGSGKAFYWYLALAASVSMVCAGGLSLQQWMAPGQPKEQLPQIKGKTAIAIVTPEVQQPQMEQQIPERLTRIQPIQTVQGHLNSTPVALKPVFYKKSIQPEAQLAVLTKKAQLHPELRLNLSTHNWQVSPELYLKKTVSSKALISHFGISFEPRIGYNFSGMENRSGNPKVDWSVYLNAVIGNDQAPRPWLLKVGYTPINAQNAAPIQQAFKVNYQIQLKKHWYIGPEIILTQGFRKAYPALTVSFG